MNLFNRFKQNIVDSEMNRWMSLTVVIFLLISVALTVNILQLQQEIRQQAGESCKVINAECNNNQSNKLCCSGLTCVPKNQNGNGKCELMPTPIPTTYVSPTYEEGPSSTPEPGVPSSVGSGITSNPTPVLCGPNGCGWSPRPEGEKSTTEPPGVQVCTMSFNGPTQLIGTRLSPTSIRFNWWPTPGGADKQLIQYGLESGKPQWGLINIAGDQGQILIDDLPANSTIWAQVRAYRGNCYEDTGWVSVGSTYQAKQTATVLQQTGVPTPTITVHPTSISMNSSYYAASKTEVKPLVNRPFLILLTLIASLFALAFIMRKFLFLLFFKKRRKKKE